MVSGILMPSVDNPSPTRKEPNMNRFEHTNEQLAREKLEQYIKRCEQSIYIWSKLEPIIDKFHGKQITKRIANEVKKVLPEYTVHYTKSYSRYELVIWGNGIDYANRKVWNLGYFSWGGILNKELIIEQNQHHLLDKERVPKYQKALSRLSDWQQQVEAIDKAQTSLMDDMEQYGAEYIYCN